MSDQASSHLAIFQDCVVQAIQNSSALMNQVVKGGRTSLGRVESGASNAEHLVSVHQALKALDQYGLALEKMFPEALKRFFSDNPAELFETEALDENATDFGELSLMDENAVAAQVELSRVRQIVKNLTEAEFALLNTFACSALGLGSVQPEKNPFNPENYIRALQFVVDEVDVAFELRQLWMQHMGETLGRELATSYRELARALKSKRIKPVGYALAIPRQTPRVQTDAEVDVMREPQGGRAEQALGPGSVLPKPDPIRKEVDALLQDIEQLEALADTLAAPLVQSKVVKQVTPAEQASIQPPAELLGDMLSVLTQSPRIPPALRQLVRDFELPLSRLVKRDAAFFTHPDHAARKLLDSMILRGSAYPADKPAALERFMHLASETLRYLMVMPVHDATAFEHVFQMWERAWSKRAAKAQGTQNMEELARQNASDFSRLTAFAQAPRAIADFVAGPWADVAAHAQIHADKRLAGKYLTLVPILLWSALPPSSLDDARRLLAMNESMLKSVREGLARIEYPPSEIERIAAQLAELRARLTAQVERENASVNASVNAAVRSSGVDIALDDYEVGQWFDMQVHERRVRTQLTWASPQRSSFMFTAHDGSTQSLTLRMLNKLAQEDALKRVDAHHDDALVSPSH